LILKDALGIEAHLKLDLSRAFPVESQVKLDFVVFGVALLSAKSTR